MIYQIVLTVPANTPQASPVRQILKPTVGTLTRVSIYFRDGCLDAVGVRLLTSGGRQLAPLPGGQWFRDNNYHIDWIENTRVEGPPWELIAEGFSEAIDWPHTIDFRIEMHR